MQTQSTQTVSTESRPYAAYFAEATRHRYGHNADPAKAEQNEVEGMRIYAALFPDAVCVQQARARGLLQYSVLPPSFAL